MLAGDGRGFLPGNAFSSSRKADACGCGSGIASPASCQARVTSLDACLLYSNGLWFSCYLPNAVWSMCNMSSEQKPKKKRSQAYRFTQAIYHPARPEKQAKSRIGGGLFILILLVAVVILYFLLRLF
jgi:hypothetical protein